MSVGCDNPLNDKRDERIFDLFKRRFDAEIESKESSVKEAIWSGLSPS
jgi:hypothetical protein